MRQLFQRSDAMEPSSQYDLQAFVPQVVVVGGGTNDFTSATLSATKKVVSPDVQPLQQWLQAFEDTVGAVSAAAACGRGSSWCMQAQLLAAAGSPTLVCHSASLACPLLSPPQVRKAYPDAAIVLLAWPLEQQLVGVRNTQTVRNRGGGEWVAGAGAAAPGRALLLRRRAHRPAPCPLTSPLPVPLPPQQLIYSQYMGLAFSRLQMSGTGNVHFLQVWRGWP